MKKKTFGKMLLGLTLFLILPSCNKSGLEDKIDLIAVQTSKDGNWSMLDKDGKIIYEDEFKNKPSAAVNGFFSVEEKDGYTLYKIGGKNPEAVKGMEKLKSVGYMDEGLIPATPVGERIAIFDETGNKQFSLNPIKNQEVIECGNAYSDGLLWIRLEDGSIGYIDKKGKLAIPAKYKVCTDFQDGIALVGTEVKGKDDSSDSKMTISVINDKGEELFKLKEGYEPAALRFYNDKLLVANDNNYYLFDKKGEKTKLSSKIDRVIDVNDDYIIFRNNERKVGVMDYKGEVIIRAKYEQIGFAQYGQFFAVKDENDKEVLLLNKEGETEETLDYSGMSYLPGFGYLALENETAVLLGNDFKQKCKEEFYGLSLDLSVSSSVSTDYFDMAAVAKTLVGMITSDGIGSYKLDTPASVVMKGEDPRRYTYTSDVNFESLNKSGFRYTIEGSGVFNESMAEYDYDYYSYEGSYKWNPNSKLSLIGLELSCESEWGEKGFDAMKDALKSAGYSVVKSGTSSYNVLAALYSKGSVIVYVLCDAEGRKCNILVGSNNDINLKENIMNLIDEDGKVVKANNDDDSTAYVDDMVVEVVNEADYDEFID